LTGSIAGITAHNALGIALMPIVRKPVFIFLYKADGFGVCEFTRAKTPGLKFAAQPGYEGGDACLPARQV